MVRPSVEAGIRRNLKKRRHRIIKLVRTTQGESLLPAHALQNR
jgi:hypothetical protein